MRKHSHKVLFKITNKQIEAIERQYWSKYNQMIQDYLYEEIIIKL